MTTWIDKLLEDPVHINEMPTLKELKMTLRSSLALVRKDCCPGCVQTGVQNYNWAVCELKHIGQEAVVGIEIRRHELILQGYSPPEELN